MIIVSEPSAKAARRVRVDRSSPACNRRVAARSDTPRQAQARQISVHTEVLTGIRPLRSPRDRPTPARRHQGHLRCRCRDGASATLDLVEPTQRRPGMRERGRTGRAHQPRACQIRARYSGDRRGTAGSHGDTDRRTPATVPTRYHRSAAISAAWRVKDSNLGRHQPTDLQSTSKPPLTSTNAHEQLGCPDMVRRVDAARLQQVAVQIGVRCAAGGPVTPGTVPRRAPREHWAASRLAGLSTSRLQRSCQGRGCR